MTLVAALTMVLAANALTDMGPRARKAARRHAVQQRYRAPRHHRPTARFRHRQAPPPRHWRHHHPRYKHHAPPPRYRRHATARRYAKARAVRRRR